MGVGAAAALVGLGAASATMQVMGANQQANAYKQKAAYDAGVYEQQASMISEQKKLSDYQYNRQAAKMRGAVVSRTAGSGFELSGSPLAIMVDNETQMAMDHAIEGYNYDIERYFALSKATSSRMEGANNARLARTTGYSNAFTTLLNTGASAYTMRKK
jgi:hypothetical protein